MSEEISKKIYYTCVARGVTILSEFTETKGNSYRDFTQGLLKKTKVGRHVMEYSK